MLLKDNMILAGTQTGIGGGSQTQCANVTYAPPDGTDNPVTVVMTSATAGSHIFYTMNNDVGITPTHVGDNATGSTTRIGSNTGTVLAGSVNHEVIIKALAYKSGLLDSAITTATYPPQGGGGGGGG